MKLMGIITSEAILILITSIYSCFHQKETDQILYLTGMISSALWRYDFSKDFGLFITFLFPMIYYVTADPLFYLLSVCTMFVILDFQGWRRWICIGIQLCWMYHIQGILGVIGAISFELIFLIFHRYFHVAFSMGERVIIAQGLLIGWLKAISMFMNAQDHSLEEIFIIYMTLGVIIFVFTQHFLNLDPFGFLTYLIMYLFVVQFPVMKHAMKVHPFYWFLRMIWKDHVTFTLTISWMVIILISFLLMSLTRTEDRQVYLWRWMIPKIIMRKYFHIMTYMFIPGVILRPGFMSICYAGAFCVFVIVECLRIEYREFQIGKRIDNIIRGFTDERDDGPIIVTHIYLLFGCAVPLWLNPSDRVVGLLGILVLGVGDTMASVFGVYFGKNHWPESKKTIEGTLGAFFSMFALSFVLKLVLPFNLTRMLVSSLLVSLLESFTGQIDNLSLPLYFVWIYLL